MSAWKRRQLDRLWMAKAERLLREESEASGGSWADADIYYMGGGVYRCSFGTRCRGASVAREFIENAQPLFAMRVSLAAGQIDRTNGGGKS